MNTDTPPTQPRGKFITFEGPEGSGKSTQIGMLQEYLTEHGADCVITREPGGTALAEQLREIVKHFQGEEIVANETEVLLFEASRAQHVRNVILPAVEAGKFVLCDRFYDSTTAYQGYAREQDLDFIQRLNQYAVDGCIPDLTLLMDLPPEVGLQRANERNNEYNHDRLEAEGLEFHNRVREGFLEIASQEPGRVWIVDAERPVEIVHSEIVEIVKSACKLY